jgi:hypothetical protein
VAQLNSAAAVPEAVVMTETETPTPTLTEFASTANPPRRCLLCNVPQDIERQTREGKAAGITYKLIAEWLMQLGYKNVTKGRLEKHFQNEHVWGADQ